MIDKVIQWWEVSESYFIGERRSAKLAGDTERQRRADRSVLMTRQFLRDLNKIKDQK